MYQQVSLKSDEILVCLFLRGDGEPVDRIAVTDFERRLSIGESGISLFRRSLCTYKTIVERVKRRPKLNRGIATVSVSDLEGQGFRIFGDLEIAPEHVCLHCSCCDGLVRNCSPKSESDFCPFTLDSQAQQPFEAHSLRQRLAESLSILFPAILTTENLLLVLGKDVSESNPLEANITYEKRLAEYIQTSGSTP